MCAKSLLLIYASLMCFFQCEFTAPSLCLTHFPAIQKGLPFYRGSPLLLFKFPFSTLLLLQIHSPFGLYSPSPSQVDVLARSIPGISGNPSFFRIASASKFEKLIPAFSASKFNHDGIVQFFLTARISCARRYSSKSTSTSVTISLMFSFLMSSMRDGVGSSSPSSCISMPIKPMASRAISMASATSSPCVSI